MDLNESDPPPDIVSFWQGAGRERWFASDRAFDDLCRERFLGEHRLAASGSLDGWRRSAAGAVGLVILLDQIPRNIFRGTPAAWATDADALVIAGASISDGYDRQVDADLVELFYLPFMHAEDLAMQIRSVALYEKLGNVDALKFARHHRDIVAEFGRFPHRNAILGRLSTPAELTFLERNSFRG